VGSGVRRGGVRRPRHFVAYGGPENGSIVRVRNGADECMIGDGRYTQTPSFSYVLVDAPDGGAALVPKHDHDLLSAYHDADSSDHRRAVPVLKGELKRRGLR
jgi:hypothetical protein